MPIAHANLAHTPKANYTRGGRAWHIEHPTDPDPASSAQEEDGMVGCDNSQ